MVMLNARLSGAWQYVNFRKVCVRQAKSSCQKATKIRHSCNFLAAAAEAQHIRQYKRFLTGLVDIQAAPPGGSFN
jgi:hypothetical protein